jgi:menaquinone-dependent protoporphyrinogen IX oxidase
MKGLVIYKGKYGATKQYAMWIGQELKLAVASADRFPVDQLANYDYFILGSSVYIGKLEIRNWLTRNLALLGNKKLFFFQVAAAPVEEREKRESFNRSSIPEDLLKKMKVFYLPGRMKMRNLSGWDRFLLKMGARLTKDPAEKKRMLTDFDHVKKGEINPLTEAVRSFEEIQSGELIVIR